MKSNLQQAGLIKSRISRITTLGIFSICKDQSILLGNTFSKSPLHSLSGSVVVGEAKCVSMSQI